MKVIGVDVEVEDTTEYLAYTHRNSDSDDDCSTTSTIDQDVFISCNKSTTIRNKIVVPEDNSSSRYRISPREFCSRNKKTTYHSFIF